jgi:hypothetical protein
VEASDLLRTSLLQLAKMPGARRRRAGAGQPSGRATLVAGSVVADVVRRARRVGFGTIDSRQDTTQLDQARHTRDTYSPSCASCPRGV